MAQMIQVIIRMAREKGTVDDTGFVNTVSQTQGVIEGPAYHPASFAMPEIGASH